MEMRETQRQDGSEEVKFPTQSQGHEVSGTDRGTDRTSAIPKP
jgi:hypothetical protein